MKQLLTTLALVIATSMLGQSNQFEKGYYDGYCQAHKNSDDINQNGPCPVLGTYPLPEPMKESYQDGFAKGMQDYAGKGSSRGKADVGLLNASKRMYESQRSASSTPQVWGTNGETITVPPPTPQALAQNDEILVNQLPQYNNKIIYLDFSELYGFTSGTNFRLRQGARDNGFKAVRTSKPYKLTSRRPKKMNPENSLRVEMEKDCVYSTIQGIKHRDCHYVTKVFNSDNMLIYHNISVNGGTERQVRLIRKAMRL